MAPHANSCLKYEREPGADDDSGDATGAIR